MTDNIIEPTQFTASKPYYESNIAYINNNDSSFVEFFAIRVRSDNILAVDKYTKKLKVTLESSSEEEIRGFLLYYQLNSHELETFLEAKLPGILEVVNEPLVEFSIEDIQVRYLVPYSYTPLDENHNKVLYINSPPYALKTVSLKVITRGDFSAALFAAEKDSPNNYGFVKYYPKTSNNIDVKYPYHRGVSSYYFQLRLTAHSQGARYTLDPQIPA